jgi:tetratricopeptide (TPR) repeat protein
MKTFKFNSSLLVVFFCLFVSWKLKLLKKKPSIELSKQMTAFNFDSKFLSIFSFGQKRLYSDIFWITTLLESDLEHFKRNDKNSWMFLRFKTITDLDPYFLMNYQFGGQYLSIVKDDLEGAAVIFEKGLLYYPDDYKLNFNSGFLYAFETGEYKKALKRYNKILHNPKSPPYVKSIIAKLSYSAGTSLKETFNIVKEMRNSEAAPQIIKKLDLDLYSIKAELDLECLNTSESGRCETKDYLGNFYIKRKDKYHAVKAFKKYRLNINKKKGTN